MWHIAHIRRQIRTLPTAHDLCFPCKRTPRNNFPTTPPPPTRVCGQGPARGSPPGPEHWTHLFWTRGARVRHHPSTSPSLHHPYTSPCTTPYTTPTPPLHHPYTTPSTTPSTTPYTTPPPPPPSTTRPPPPPLPPTPPLHHPLPPPPVHHPYTSRGTIKSRLGGWPKRGIIDEGDLLGSSCAHLFLRSTCACGLQITMQKPLVITSKHPEACRSLQLGR